MEQLLEDYFGEFGGQFVAEPLVGLLEELALAYKEASSDPEFLGELETLQRNYIGRPTPLTPLPRTSRLLGGAQILLKREDLAHTGAHKINNALAQALLARHMGKQRIIAETGAGQHGVATATACALLGLDCVIYMGAVDVCRQAPNVERMKLLGATVRPVTTGSQTLKDAINEAIRDWISHVETTHYLIGSVVGPYPFPAMVRNFQAVIGTEAREQILTQTGRLPDTVVACVGGGSNAMGIFHAFLADEAVRLVGVQAGGEQSQAGERRHSSPLLVGRPGILQGAKTMLLQDADGQILKSHSIAPGLDYPGVGPQHSYLAASGRVRYESVDDAAALAAFAQLSRWEGIIPALESSHALAKGFAIAQTLPQSSSLIINLSGRGDKDLTTAAAALGLSRSHPSEEVKKP